jgi:hypothetical protein
MTPVTSSNIVALGHENNVLRVEFKNGTSYDYQNVPPQLYDQLFTAKSIGGFLAANIKPKPHLYPYSKVS